jgi:hypothetical protein
VVSAVLSDDVGNIAAGAGTWGTATVVSSTTGAVFGRDVKVLKRCAVFEENL